MLAEWSAECTTEDPVLVVPWADPSGKAAFVDLRANPYDFDAIPEAEHHPPLMQALRALNAARSPVFTAKCDAWPLSTEELDHLQLTLDLDSVEQPLDLPCGFASYIDLIVRDKAIFTSFPRHEQLLHRLIRLATPLGHPNAALECVIRPAFVDLEIPQQGFAVSLYVKVLGSDLQASLDAWAAALAAVVALVRSKELAH